MLRSHPISNLSQFLASIYESREASPFRPVPFIESSMFFPPRPMDAKKDLEHYMGMVQLRGKTEWKLGRKGRMEAVLVSHRSTCRGQSAQNPGIPFADYDQEGEYKEFKVRINGLVGMAHKVPEEGWTMQDGTPWPGNNLRDHPRMIKVFLDGAHDVEGNQLPHLIYVSREKRPEFYHHKKAGAMNALVDISPSSLCLLKKQTPSRLI